MSTPDHTTPNNPSLFPSQLTPEQRRALLSSTTINGDHQKPIEILTYGGGAMGALYSWIISRGPRKVNFTVVCRSNYPTVSTSGYTITSELFGAGNFCPQSVIRDPKELLHPSDSTKCVKEFDYIFICTKSSGKVEIPNYIVTQRKTALVLFQNGINIEEPYKAAFPENAVISAVLYVSCVRPQPGMVVHVGDIDIVKLGLYPDGSGGEEENVKLKLVEGLLRGGGCNANAVMHVQSDRWLKTVWNGCWNVLCAVSGLDTQGFLASSPQAKEAVRRISRELVAVARRALGVVREDGTMASEGDGKVAGEVWGLWRDDEFIAERTLKTAEGAVPITPSMLQDARRGLEMEVEGVCGEVVRTGERLGVDIPVLRTMYSILQAMNCRFRQGKEVELGD